MPFILRGAQILRPKVRQVTDVYCSFATNLSSFPHLNTFFKTFTVQKCHFCKCDAALFAAILRCNDSHKNDIISCYKTYCYKIMHVHVDEVTDEEKDEADEKNRLITQVLELQNTLDGE